MSRRGPDPSREYVVGPRAKRKNPLTDNAATRFVSALGRAPQQTTIPQLQPVQQNVSYPQANPAQALPPWADPVGQALSAANPVVRSKASAPPAQTSGTPSWMDPIGQALAQAQTSGMGQQTSAASGADEGSVVGASGAGGLAAQLAPYGQAEGVLRDQNTAAQHAIAQGLVDYLKRVQTTQSDYTGQADQLGQRQKADLSGVVQESQTQIDPVLADLKAQGVDPGAVQQVASGNQDTLRTQGGLQQEFLNRQQQLMQGSFADARGSGALVEQGGQATRENTLAAGLAQLALEKAKTSASYSATQANGLDGLSYTGDSGGTYDVKQTADQRLKDYLGSYGPRFNQAWQTLYQVSGGSQSKMLQFIDALGAHGSDDPTFKDINPQVLRGAVDVVGGGDTTVTKTVKPTGKLGAYGGFKFDQGVVPLVTTLMTDVPGLRISGGARDAKRNAEVNGAENSNHLSGRAVDLVGSKAAMEAGAKWAQAHGAREVLVHNAGSGRHLHIAW